MPENHIINIVESTINSLGENKNDISVESSVDNCSNWDSLATVAIASAISTKYDIDLDVEDLESCTSIYKIKKLLEKYEIK